MTLAGVSDIETDWRPRIATHHGFRLFGAAPSDAEAMHAAGATVSGTLDDLLGETDVVVDCTPKKVAANNIDTYRRRGIRFILQAARNTRRPGTPLSPSPPMPRPSGGRVRASSPATRHPSSGHFPPSSGPASSRGRVEHCCAGQPIPGRATTAAS